MTRAPRSIVGDDAAVADDLRHFEHALGRFADGKVSDAIFLEQRLRFGVYGQRQDGVHMMRSKVPLGLLSARQLEAFADVAERFGNGRVHLTTRQDIQTHFVELQETPALMRVLANANMTTREACGNVVRNITASPLAGVSPTEAFDVTPYGMALAEFLLQHPDAQGLGRKFKITLSGDRDPRFNLAAFHDIGLTAVVRDGQRGFEVRVGGGLGPVPHEALLFSDFVVACDLFPLVQAILRVFARHGEKKNRARARLKFLVARWGLKRFRDEVNKTLQEAKGDPRWVTWVSDDWLQSFTEQPAKRSDHLNVVDETRAHIIAQRQPGYSTVVVRVLSGDLDVAQLRALATLLRGVVGEHVLRVGLDQSLFIRWVPNQLLATLEDGLARIGLSPSDAGGLADMVACPGTDTCKLGITSPRALARSIQATLDDLARDPRLRHLRMHVSGCPNSCAQHQIADIGWFGAARSRAGVSSPHYMLLLGGRAGGKSDEGEALGSGFGNIVCKIPAFRVGDATRALCALYLEHQRETDRFGDVMRRVGFARVKDLLADLAELPALAAAPWAYREPGSPEPFAVHRGIGECAGAPVAHSDFLLSDAEREVDAATDLLENGDSASETARHAHRAMDRAARALLSTEHVNDLQNGDVEREFRSRFYDRGRIFEGVGYYFLEAQNEDPERVTGDRLRRLVVEAGLFVEESHSIVAKMRAVTGAPAVEARP